MINKLKIRPRVYSTRCGEGRKMERMVNRIRVAIGYLPIIVLIQEMDKIADNNKYYKF